MTDREMLELAAKAAGYNVEFARDDLGCWFAGKTTTWRPLVDDGDALRLAVKLGFYINIYHSELMQTNVGGGGLLTTELHDNDPCAATRRAITRAAAEIGKAMP